MCCRARVDEHELAWAAGFFDGDGWAALVNDRRRGRAQPHAQINQAGPVGVPEVLTRFRDAVGVGRVAGPKVEDGRQDLYWWIASSHGDVWRTGQLIGPWLSSAKRSQFLAATGLPFADPPLESVAWAGGLYDAEGSTSLSDHRSHRGFKYIEAAITQGCKALAPEELVRFSRLVGVGRVYGPYVQAGATELVYRWRIQRTDAVRNVIHLLLPWIGDVKRDQAFAAFRTIDGQPTLRRGRTEWGSHKTHCIHGHEYVTARIRPYVSRGTGTERRASKQCLACVREQARAKRAPQNKIGGPEAADRDPRGDDATC
jgi:hypothetical protein